jgi:hypothetical protein
MSEPIRLEFTSTLDDLREARVAEMATSGRRVRRRSLQPIVIIVLAIAYLFFIIRLHDYPTVYQRADNGSKVEIYIWELAVMAYSPVALFFVIRLTDLATVSSSVTPLTGIRRYRPPANRKTVTRRMSAPVWLPISLLLFFLQLRYLHPDNGALNQWNSPPILLSPYFVVPANFVLLITIYGFFGWLNFKRVARANEKKSQDKGVLRAIVVEFDGAGISFSSDRVKMVCQWIAFPKFVETENLFMLYTSNYSYRLLPKRSFTSEEQHFALLKCLTERIGVGWMLEAKPAGFQVQPASGNPPNAPAAARAADSAP